MNLWPDDFPEAKPNWKKALLLGDAVPKPLGFTAFPPECMSLGRLAPPPPFRLLGRRSGRIPALPYPPPR
jgi:hypothetical protein